MKLRLSNEEDVNAAAIVAGLQNWRSLAQVISEYSVMCPPDDDFTITINLFLLPASYRSNPSTLASHALGKVRGEFEDCAGYQTPTNPRTITIVLHRDAKSNRRTNPKPSVKTLIKEFLLLNHDLNTVIEIPVALIPSFLFSHPEQLAYNVKRETGTPITITRNSINWTISRK